MSALVVDLFAGAGGWSEGLRLAGFTGTEIGLEWDGAACRTAVAAGHKRVQCDVALYPTQPFGDRVEGLIASPPCQSFSSAGNQLGFDDPRGLLSHEPLRWAKALRPRWIALEQVPEVLPHWFHIAYELERLGYGTWCGVLCAADYGVPQTRRRAILVARNDGPVALPPAPSNYEIGGRSDLFMSWVPPWTSMTDALGWGGAGLKRDRGRGMALRHGDRDPRPMSEPAYTITCGEGGTGARMSWVWPDGTERRVNVEEAGVLQSFRADYPWRGNKSEQFRAAGNAIPPLMAAAVLSPFLSDARELVAA